MKKTVVIILLILPFLLIYFISFTGQILSKYTHINVERVVLLNDKGDEYSADGFVKIGLDEEFKLRIKIYPELASNKEVIISNSNKEVVSIDESTQIATPLKYGESTIIITSKDRHFVQYIFKIVVAQDDIEDIGVEKEITIPKGKTGQIVAQIIPETTIPEYRDLIWESKDTSIAKVNANGIVTGVSVGETEIKVKSAHKPEVYKIIIVKIVSEYGKGVWFDNNEVGKLYKVSEQIFDLREITIINLEGVTIDDLDYKLVNNPTSDQIDYSNITSLNIIEEGKITFKEENAIVKVQVFVAGIGYDYITMIYIANE